MSDIFQKFTLPISEMISDKNLARIAGFCYLIVIATGFFSEVFVRQALKVSNDALATAHNLQTH